MEDNIKHLQSKYNSFPEFHKFLANEYGLLFLDKEIPHSTKIKIHSKIHSKKSSYNNVELITTKTHTIISGGIDSSRYELPIFLDHPFVQRPNTIKITHILTDAEIKKAELEGYYTVICDYTNPYNMGYLNHTPNISNSSLENKNKILISIKSKLEYLYSEYIKKLQFAIRKLQFIDSLVQYVMYGKKKSI
jgi:hypothetical protein